MALAMVALIAMVGLIIDGGYAWGRQRDTQNGADAVAKAGTVVVQHHLAELGSPTDWHVACAVEDAADSNQVDLVAAEYTDFNGDPLVPAVEVGACADADPGVAIPPGAQGVRAVTSETFAPFLMQVIGFQELTATADATAVVGTPTGIPGGALPVTFPSVLNICDASGKAYRVRVADDDGDWEPYEILGDEALATKDNLAIVPLCDSGPGSVGFLDYGCGQTFKEAIESPCEEFIYIPDWIRTQTGNMNCCEDHMNSYAGDIVGTPEGEIFGTPATDGIIAIPIHRTTCKDDPDADESDPQVHTEACDADDWSGTGENTFYDVHFWVGFKVDQVYAKGGDPECKQDPGTPVLVNPVPAGKVSCLKGWFVDYIPAPGPISLGPISVGEDVTLTIALID